MAIFPSAKNNKYFVTVEINGEKKSFETKNLAQSLAEIKPAIIKGKILIRVEHHEKSIEKLLYVMRAKKVFFNPLATKIFARDIERALV